MFSLAFIIWNLDNVFCGTLTQWKRKAGWPLAFLLEGQSYMFSRCFVQRLKGHLRLQVIRGGMLSLFVLLPAANVSPTLTVSDRPLEYIL